MTEVEATAVLGLSIALAVFILIVATIKFAKNMESIVSGEKKADKPPRIDNCKTVGDVIAELSLFDKDLKFRVSAMDIDSPNDFERLFDTGEYLEFLHSDEDEVVMCVDVKSNYDNSVIN